MSTAAAIVLKRIDDTEVERDEQDDDEDAEGDSDYVYDDDEEEDEESEVGSSTSASYSNRNEVDFSAVNLEYMREITSILEARSEVSCSNALALNKEMQCRLQEVRTRLQLLLRQLDERYENNEERLKQSIKRSRGGIGMRGAYLKGGTFFFKGNMFFKDRNCRNAPNNPDYERRSGSEGEIFPMDFELRGRHVWSLVDKVSIVQAIKEQVVDYLADCARNTAHKSKATITSTRNKLKQRSLQRKVSAHTDKLVNLLAQVDNNFSIDWEQVSAHNLRHRHSPSSCKAMWTVYLQPTMSRTAWTAEEKDNLLEAAEAHNFQNWTAIAQAMNTRRSDYQCFVMFQTQVCYQLSSLWARWRKEDDGRLLKAIEENTQNGVINWNVVASQFPSKSKQSLQGRYCYSLHPTIYHGHFSPEEDLLILAAVKEYGERFSCHPRTLFPNRSLAQLRSRYKNTLKHRSEQSHPWTLEDDKKLMEFVAANGASSWLKCSEALGNHYRHSCRTRFNTIKKYFAQHPTAALEDLPRKKSYPRHGLITPENWLEKVAELRENPNATLKPEKMKKKRWTRPPGSRKKPKREPKPEKELKPRQQRKNGEKKERKPRKSKKSKSENEAAACVLKVEVNEEDASVTTLVAPTKPKPTKPPKSYKYSIYTARLRQIGLQLYHFFKFSYNWRLGTDPCRNWPRTGHSLLVASTALGYQMPSPPMSNTNNVDLRLPPSWPTAMGFRALCVQSANVAEAPENPVLENSEAVQRFRQRLRTLFYKTALLSRLHPESIANLQQRQPAPVVVMETFDEDEAQQNAQMTHCFGINSDMAATAIKNEAGGFVAPFDYAQKPHEAPKAVARKRRQKLNEENSIKPKRRKRLPQMSVDLKPTQVQVTSVTILPVLNIKTEMET